MEPVVISLGGRGRAIRARQPVESGGPCGFGPIRSGRADRDHHAVCASPARCARSGRPSQAPARQSGLPSRSLLERGPKGPPRPGTHAQPAIPRRHRPRPLRRRPSPPPALGQRARARLPAKRFKVRDEFGKCVVARFHGQYGDKTALILPDGQLGIANRLVPTDEPFQPLTADQLADPAAQTAPSPNTSS